MATTQISDIYNQDLLAAYQAEDSVVKSAIYQSGILASNPIINELAGGHSNIINIPFWKPLDTSLEPNYSTDDPADVAVPQKVITAEQTARVAYLNEGFSSADLTTEITSQEPLKFVAASLDKYWIDQAQKRVVATATGLYNDNVAANSGDMVVDVSLTTGTVTDANKFSAGAFIDADATFGDSLDETGAIIVHRKVYTAMQKSQLIEFVADPETKFQIPFYMGKRVVVDNGVPVIGTGQYAQYISIIFGAGAIGYGMQLPKNSTAFQRVEAQGNGGGIETLWTRRNMIIHPFGYKFTSTTITGNTTEANGAKSASWADLALATNWTRQVARQNVPLAFLVTNA